MLPPEIREKVRGALGVPASYSRLTDVNIDDFVDEAFQLMANEIVPSRLATSVTLTLVADQDTYSVAGNPTRIIGVSIGGAFIQPYTLQHLEVDAPTWATAASGTPKRYWIEGNDSDGNPQIRLHPKPSAGGTARVSVIKKPPRLGSYGLSEVRDWSELAQYAAIHYAAWRSGLRASEVVDANKQAMLMDTYRRYVGILASNEDPTSVYTQQMIQQRVGREATQ